MLLVLIGMLCRHSYQLGLRQYDLQKQANYTNTNAAQQQASSKAKATPPRAHRVDKSKLPYKCGLVFFYHIQSTGGATIEQWLREYTPSKNSTTATHFQHWGRKKEQTPDRYKVQELFIHGNLDHQEDTEKDIPKHQHHVIGMDNFVTNIQPNEWRIAHCHHSSMNLNITEQFLTQWRSIIEEQGCAFIANVMFRDALSHALSLFKYIDHDHITSPNDAREEWVSHLYSRSNMGQWQSQLDYFLYNFLDRNPVSV